MPGSKFPIPLVVLILLINSTQAKSAVVTTWDFNSSFNSTHELDGISADVVFPIPSQIDQTLFHRGVAFVTARPIVSRETPSLTVDFVLDSQDLTKIELSSIERYFSANATSAFWSLRESISVDGGTFIELSDALLEQRRTSRDISNLGPVDSLTYRYEFIDKIGGTLVDGSTILFHDAIFNGKVVAVPEPATVGSLITLGTCIFLRRRRRC